MRQVKPYLEGDASTSQRVGANYVDSSGGHGSFADISADKTWLNIVSDPYEGHVMLHIETLPYLRRALARLARSLAKS